MIKVRGNVGLAAFEAGAIRPAGDQRCSIRSGGTGMTNCAHLWAVGFGESSRAAQVRDEIARLAYEQHDLELLDVVVAVRYPDGTLTLNGEPFPVVIKSHGGTLARLLASLALGAPPLTSAAVGTLLANTGGAAGTVGISNDFVQEVACLIKPGTSVLFVLDEEPNMEAILRAIRGLGGTVLKTNVDIERAKLIQSTLAATADTNQPT
jgi:uncharacterized membrane protein